MPIKKAPTDDYIGIMKTASINALFFLTLEEEKDFQAVKVFRKRVEQIFQRLDGEMVKLCSNDVDELTQWAARIGTVRRQLDELDRNLAFAGQRQFNWARVIEVMSFLNALRVASEQTVEINTTPG